MSRDTTTASRFEKRREDFDRVAYRFRQNPMSTAGLTIIVALLLIAVFALWIAPYPQDAGYQRKLTAHSDKKFQSPSLTHLFGIGQAGRNILSRVLFGTRLSLQIDAVILAGAVAIDVPVGPVADYMGGALGMTSMRITNIFLSIPPLVLVLGASVALEPSLTNAMTVIAIVWWPWYARLTYGEVIPVKEETFVEASRGVGAPSLRTVFYEILPNVLAPITVKMSLDVGYAILVASVLGFLGLGAQSPIPERGIMMSQGRGYLPAQWWYSTFPGLAIFVTALEFNFLGDGLRDMFDVGAQ